MAGSKWCLLALSLAALRADTLTLAAGSNYIAVGANDALTLTTNSANAQTFERLFAGNGYFYLRMNGAAYVATDPASGALAVTAAGTAAAEQFQTITLTKTSVNILARSTSGYLEVTGNAVVANAHAAQATAFALTATPDATPSVEIDFFNPRQQIVGFGAADAFYSGWLTAHPNKEQIYALLFAPENLGASVLRVQNWWGQTTTTPFDPDTEEVVAKANAYRGSPITVLLSSWSPPASLKASGKVNCVGATSEPGCTLAKVNGSYNYAGFAQYWNDSLNAYAGLGVVPNYISLQNEPDWTPGGYGGCRFDPTEAPGGIYAGYKQALEATYSELQLNMTNPPAIVGPELVGIGYNTIENYVSALDANDLSELGAVAHHLYTGGDSGAPDTFDSSMLELVNAAPSKQLFETEYDHSSDQSSAMDTAWLIHNAMATEEDSVYLFWSYFWPDHNQLVYIDNPFAPSTWTYPSGYSINDYYYAVQHFSRFVQPGFQRFASITGTAELRATAYYNPLDRRLVLVLINTSATDTLSQTLVLPAYPPGQAIGGTEPTRTPTKSTGTATSVYRSTFSGTDERFAPLGALAANNVVTLPPQAVATVVIDYGAPDCRATRRCSGAF